MLNKRGIDIIEYLLENNLQGVLKDLAEKFEISERSIRYDLENINYYLNKAGLSEIEKSSKGVYSLLEEKEVLNKFLEKMKARFYIYTSEERKEYMKAKFLFFQENKLLDFCEELDVSLSTVKSDMKEVKLYLMDNGLNLVFVSKLGIVLEGNEEKIRKVQLKFLNKYLEIKNGTLDIKEEKNEVKALKDEVLTLLESVQMKSIKIFIKRIEKKLHSIISDEAYAILQIYIVLMITRIKEGKILESRENNKKFLSETDEYKILEAEILTLEEEYKIDLTEAEILCLTEFFLGSHSYNFSSSFFDNWIELELSVNSMVSNLSVMLEIDLTRDQMLVDGLLNHLKPAYYRIRNEIVLENKIAKEVEEVYSDLYSKVKKICENQLESYIGKKIPEEEIAFLTIHFKSAIDRKLNAQRKTKNILLVCGLGYGSSKLLAQKISERYDVNIVDTIPHHKFLELETLKNIDLLVTTLDISSDFIHTFPVVKVHPILTKEDRELLEKYGLNENRKKISLKELLKVVEEETEVKNRENLIKKLKQLMKNRYVDDLVEEEKISLATLLRRENIIFDVEAKDWKEALRLSGEILVKNGSVLPEYVDDMVETVNRNGSYMIVANKLALPHARTEGLVKKTDMCLVRLKNPVTFPGEKEIKIILAFSSRDQKEHMEALTTLVNLIEENNFIKAIETSTEEEIHEMITTLLTIQIK